MPKKKKMVDKIRFKYILYLNMCLNDKKNSFWKNYCHKELFPKLSHLNIMLINFIYLI